MKKVRIGGKDFNIVEQRYLSLNGKVCTGIIENGDAVIYIDPTLEAEQSQSETLLHEILHGIAYFMQIELPADTEEDIIDAFARGLYMVLKDNPNLQKELK